MDCLPSGPVHPRVWVTAVSRPRRNGVLYLQDGLSWVQPPLLGYGYSSRLFLWSGRCVIVVVVFSFCLFVPCPLSFGVLISHRLPWR